MTKRTKPNFPWFYSVFFLYFSKMPLYFLMCSCFNMLLTTITICIFNTSFLFAFIKKLWLMYLNNIDCISSATQSCHIHHTLFYSFCCWLKYHLYLLVSASVSYLRLCFIWEFIVCFFLIIAAHTVIPSYHINIRAYNHSDHLISHSD